MCDGYMMTEMVEVATGKVVRSDTTKVWINNGKTFEQAVASYWASTQKSYRRGKYACRLVGSSLRNFA